LEGICYRCFEILCLPLLLATARLLGATPLPIHYQLDLREPTSHLVRVTMTIPEALPETKVQIPTWNNLYQIRDFVRDVEQVGGTCGGEPAELTRVDLNTWQGPDRPCSWLQLRYTVYADGESPFSSVLSEDHAFLNFALILFYLSGDRDRPVQVNFLLPKGWKLATLLAGDGPEYTAPDYDVLVDSPAEAGHFQEYSYEQKVRTRHCEAGHATVSSHDTLAKYRVIVDAAPSDYSAVRLLNSLKKITATETALMEDVPFSRYTFILHFLRKAGSGGGMEHRNGTAITLPAATLQRDWGALESMAAHEFFHTWNVKRIRPKLLEPIDYIHGNDTRDLWFCEGVTSAYGEYTLLRAGLTDPQTFYGRLAGAIQALESRPARHFQSAETSGREAWLEKYRDYLRPERSISYYNKGELLGFLLDLGIRHATHNQASLDEVMRCLNERFARQHRFFTATDLQDIIANLAPLYTDREAFFRDDVQGTRELDYERYLGYAGLRLVRETREVLAPGFTLIRNPKGQLQVESVDATSAAQAAGLARGDILLEADGQVLAELPAEGLLHWKPGEVVVFKVLREGRTRKITLTMGRAQETTYRVLEAPETTAEQREVREGWLYGTTTPRPGIEFLCCAQCASH
jgi:predicted metalloprotease with PDZ domain